jgi:hypothetical protein
MILGALALSCATVAIAAAPPPAAAFNPIKPVCGVGGLISGLVGKACSVLQKSSRLLSASKKLLSGHVGEAAKALVGGGVSKVGFAAGLTAVGAWVLVGARASLDETATLIARTTSPQLQTTWFSATYWRMAGIAAVLTLPFLFAAAVQAVVRSDLALLVRAAFGYLPLALLAVSIAAPVTMLLLAASDEMSAIVSSAAGGDGARALAKIGGTIGAVSTIDGSAFLAFLLGLFVVAAAFALWLELMIREAAVYVVVLMLPLAFAALVWPARRVWAARAVELLIALILAKFAIVAVLTLAAAALGHRVFAGPTAMLAGVALLTLAAFAPWALVRLMPMAEVASGAAGSLRREAMGGRMAAEGAEGTADRGATALETHAQGRHAPPAPSGARDGAMAETEKLGDTSGSSVAPTNGGEPSGHGGEPSGNGGEPSGNGGEPSGNGSEPSGNGGEPSGNGGEPSGNGDSGSPARTPGVPETRLEDDVPSSPIWIGQEPPPPRRSGDDEG